MLLFLCEEPYLVFLAELVLVLFLFIVREELLLQIFATFKSIQNVSLLGRGEMGVSRYEVLEIFEIVSLSIAVFDLKLCIFLIFVMVSLSIQVLNFFLHVSGGRKVLVFELLVVSQQELVGGDEDAGLLLHDLSDFSISLELLQLYLKVFISYSTILLFALELQDLSFFKYVFISRYLVEHKVQVPQEKAHQ